MRMYAQMYVYTKEARRRQQTEIKSRASVTVEDETGSKQTSLKRLTPPRGIDQLNKARGPYVVIRGRKH